ncbi:hypothetical protein [Dyella terrae]|uniref:hypothetical protein n=1 Tax=Dyella terrae TaxID=522259 RepID=UPI001EFEE0E9|nr:hypothetical protein [Dyella terrae]
MRNLDLQTPDYDGRHQPKWNGKKKAVTPRTFAIEYLRREERDSTDASGQNEQA